MKLQSFQQPVLTGLLLSALLFAPGGQLALPSSSLSSASGTTEFSGRATALRATVLGIETVVSDTGPLPSSGGAREASLLQASAPGLLSAEVLHASTVGEGDQSRSQASVADLSLTVGGHTVTAGFLEARAAAVCTSGGAAVNGSSEVANLAIDGQAITVTGEPNQTIPLPNGRVVINEQRSSVSGGTGEITVTALRVVVDGTADVAVSSAHADVVCGAKVCPGNDFITGGGWITGTPSGAKGNFGVAGGIKNGQFWGHLLFIDHGDRLKVKGTGVTAYDVVNATTRHIEGTAEINGEGGFHYEVDVADNGEPGRQDTFALSLSNGYAASGFLAGGNIQLHACR